MKSLDEVTMIKIYAKRCNKDTGYFDSETEDNRRQIVDKIKNSKLYISAKRVYYEIISTTKHTEKIKKIEPLMEEGTLSDVIFTIVCYLPIVDTSKEYCIERVIEVIKEVNDKNMSYQEMWDELEDRRNKYREKLIRFGRFLSLRRLSIDNAVQYEDIFNLVDDSYVTLIKNQKNSNPLFSRITELGEKNELLSDILYTIKLDTDKIKGINHYFVIDQLLDEFIALDNRMVDSYTAILKKMYIELPEDLEINEYSEAMRKWMRKYRRENEEVAIVKDSMAHFISSNTKAKEVLINLIYDRMPESLKGSNMEESVIDYIKTLI